MGEGRKDNEDREARTSEHPESAIPWGAVLSRVGAVLGLLVVLCGAALAVWRGGAYAQDIADQVAANQQAAEQIPAVSSRLLALEITLQHQVATQTRLQDQLEKTNTLLLQVLVAQGGQMPPQP